MDTKIDCYQHETVLLGGTYIIKLSTLNFLTLNVHPIW